MTNEVEKTSEVVVDQAEESQQDEFVSKKAYQDVSNDMHKYKQDLRDAKARLNEIESERAAQEKEKLAELGQWEELYNKNNAELAAIKAKRDQEQNQFVDYHKKNSVLQKIGGFKRDEYNKFIDVNSIVMNEDGSIDDASLSAEIDRVRQEYPELLKKNATTKLPNDAPNGNQMGDLSGRDMSAAEKDAYFKKMLTKK